jgi:hypothetical protein
MKIIFSLFFCCYPIGAGCKLTNDITSSVFGVESDFRLKNFLFHKGSKKSALFLVWNAVSLST